MMATTSAVVFITGYHAVTRFFGLCMSKRASKDLNAYCLGGRTIPWWILGTSGMAAWFDLTGTMLNAGAQRGSLNNWTHVAITYDGSTVRAYGNGNPERLDAHDIAAALKL